MDSPHHSSPESSHHQDGQQSVRKRKRKTFSCDACRKRKLKCTRELPICSRCQKSGNAANCVYENPPEPGRLSGFTPSASHIPESDYRSSLLSGSNFLDPLETRPFYPSPNQAADRLAAIENRLAVIDPKISENLFKRPRLDPDVNIEPTFVTKEKEIVDIGLYGAGFRTAFYGPSSERNLASYYPTIMKIYSELKVFISFHNLQNPLFAQLRTHMRGIRKNSKAAKKILQYPSVITLLDAVPDKETCTKMVSWYWESIASTYHIFHAPTFWSTFWLYWGDPQQRTEPFACTILLMLACVSTFDRQQTAKYRGLSSVAREQASYWVDICESWLHRQSRKHLTIESFQNRVLLVIAKQINVIKMKQVWERASELLTFAVATGLHQDTAKIEASYVRDQAQGISLKTKTTPYDREMRRRIWAAVVELEMQASIDKGIPSSRLALLADCGRPTLLVDDQFETSSSAIPTPEARSKYTAISYLCLSQETLTLRATLSDVVNTGIDRLSYEDIMAYDDQIKRALNDLPEWVRVKAKNAPSSNDLSATPAALLELQLLQFQLLLHTPSARRTDNGSRSNLSRITCIDVGMRILDLYILLTHSSSTNSGIHWLNLMREDIFRSVVTVCYNLILWRSLNSDFSSMAMKDMYTGKVLQGAELLKHKVLLLGEQFLQSWHVVAALGMLRSSFDISNINMHVSTVAEEFTVIFESIFNAQEEMSNEQTAAGALTALATPTSGGYDAANSTTPMQSSDIPNTQPFLDGVDMSGWGGFDDLWPFSSGLSW